MYNLNYYVPKDVPQDIEKGKYTAYKHLVGWDERGKTFVAGTYALLEDSSCKFLVFDFDDHDGSHINWQEEAKSLREVCKINGIDTALERSRSGKIRCK